MADLGTAADRVTVAPGLGPAMTATELAHLEQGHRVALAVAWTDTETKARMYRYMLWRWGPKTLAVMAINNLLRHR